MKKMQIFLLGLLFPCMAFTQTIAVETLTSGTRSNLRGLSVVNDNVIWVSGSNGLVGRSTNSGKNWKWMTVKGFEKNDFRDIEAFDANTALIMAVAEPAYILKTTDGGDTWKIVYENKNKGMFLDAMDFANPMDGMVVGDPINDTMFMATTHDAGDSWQVYQPPTAIRLDSGEAFFAASGTNIRLLRKSFVAVSGGLRTRLLTVNSAIDLPLAHGTQTSGANSVAVHDNDNLLGSLRLIVVGGDFAADSSSEGNCYYSSNSGKTWKRPRVPPHGYRSCVEYISSKYAVACGLTGVDLSTNAGKSWELISKDSYNTCRQSRISSAVYFAGAGGRVGKLVLK